MTRSEPENEKTPYEVLSSINVADKVERKGNLDYLSWANAWAMLKANYPKAQRIIYENERDNINYFHDGKFGYVKVGIVVNSVEHIDMLPIMDFRNNSIPLEKITSMDVNKTIQRATAKAIAMHGLGLSLWTGEDVPELTTEKAQPAAPKAPAKKAADKPADPATPTGLTVLKVGTENWIKVAAYIDANKSLGLQVICDQLSRKYSLTPAVKKQIEVLITPPAQS